MSTQRVPEWDGLRAWMIFVVSWYHIWQQSWLRPMLGSISLDWLVRSGYVWVDGTVLLSAFLLFLPYAKARHEGSPLPDAADFYRRRVRRILPSYYFIQLLVLFSVVLPWGLYSSGPYLVKDLATHFTFTFNFFYDTYVQTPLGAASWTLAVEVQAYLVFPLLARAALKKPVPTLALTALVTFGFRAWCVWALPDYTMVVNQLLNFGDVYALGILLAWGYPALSETVHGEGTPKKRRLLMEGAATALFVISAVALCRGLMFQASSQGYVALQRRQMTMRPVFAVCFGGLILSAPFTLRPLRLLLGNRVTRFLAGISMNYYLIHQTILVHMRRIGFPHSESDTPHMAGEQPWQIQYTMLVFLFSLAAAVLITYGVEKPASRFLARRAARRAEATSASASSPSP